jgi:transcriptional pleiotropic regulator of transition state genes
MARWSPGAAGPGSSLPWRDGAKYVQAGVLAPWERISALGGMTMAQGAYVRRLDRLGRLVLPKAIRNTIGLGDRAAVAIMAFDDGIMLRRYDPSCALCGLGPDADGEGLTEVTLGRYLCEACVRLVVAHAGGARA